MTHSAKNIVHQSAALRGQRKFRESVDLVKGGYQDLDDPDVLVVVLLEAFKACVEAGWIEEAKDWAAKVRAEDPDVPSIKGY